MNLDSIESSLSPFQNDRKRSNFIRRNRHCNLHSQDSFHKSRFTHDHMIPAANTAINFEFYEKTFLNFLDDWTRAQRTQTIEIKLYNYRNIKKMCGFLAKIKRNKRQLTLHAQDIFTKTTGFEIRKICKSLSRGKGVAVEHIEIFECQKDLLTVIMKYLRKDKISELLIGGNMIENTEAVQLLHWAKWSSLQRLELTRNNIGADAIENIVSKPYWPNLEALSLRENEIGDHGARKLAENNHWIDLRRLDLSENSIELNGSIRLAGNSAWVNLQQLNLSNNNLGSIAVGRLAINDTWKKLKVLELYNCKIGPQGARWLSGNTSWKMLEVLDVSQNQIKAKGVGWLASNQSWKKLRVLNLSSNRIRSEGVRRLAANQSWSLLEELDLSHNRINYAGAEWLSMNTSWLKLKELHLELNHIGEPGKEALESMKVLRPHLRIMYRVKLNIDFCMPY